MEYKILNKNHHNNILLGNYIRVVNPVVPSILSKNPRINFTKTDYGFDAVITKEFLNEIIQKSSEFTLTIAFMIQSDYVSVLQSMKEVCVQELDLYISEYPPEYLTTLPIHSPDHCQSNLID